MSVATDTPPAFASGADASQEQRCQHCGNELREDQEWCLECGCTRTLIHRPPDWRIPLAVIGTVVAVALAAFAIALITLSNDANRSAAVITVTRTAPAAATTSAAAPPTTTPDKPRIPGWPRGLPGWTVSLSSATTRTAAKLRARAIIRAGLHLGVLSTALHPPMTPGSFIVFIGRYPTEAGARARAAKLAARGYPAATAILVGRAGG